MPIKNIIFDWSGVLSDDFDEVYNSSMKIFEENGIEKISIEQFRRDLCLPITKFYFKYLSNFSLEDLKKSFVRFFGEQGIPSLFPKTKETVFRLRDSGINMVILSANPRQYIERDLKKYELYDIFSDINTNIMNKVNIVKYIMEKNGFSPEETVFVGDMEHDIEAGKEAGVMTIATAYGHTERYRLERENPDFIINEIEEIPAIVLE